jgi:hypothetical protein
MRWGIDVQQDADQNYQDALDRLAAKCPVLARPLTHADKIRAERLSWFLDNTNRLEGLEEFSQFLDATTKWFREFPELKAITFLLWRAGADFVTAIEATISGFHAVANDSMRDVMEIELLLAEFAHDPPQMEKWLTCSPKVRMNTFGHGELRKRKAARLGIEPSELSDVADYRGHSTMLHVNPIVHPFGSKGLSQEAIDVNADMCFWDIYQHARNLFKVVLELFGQFGDSRHVEGWKPPDLGKFTREYGEAMHMQGFIMDKLRELESEDYAAE